MKNHRYPLCDFKECPLHQNCANYFDDIDKTKVSHWGVMPYKEGKGCFAFVPLSEDDLIDKVNKIVNRRMN